MTLKLEFSFIFILVLIIFKSNFGVLFVSLFLFFVSNRLVFFFCKKTLLPYLAGRLGLNKQLGVPEDTRENPGGDSEEKPADI